jgi:hypothetical protein
MCLKFPFSHFGRILYGSHRGPTASSLVAWANKPSFAPVTCTKTKHVSASKCKFDILNHSIVSTSAQRHLNILTHMKSLRPISALLASLLSATATQQHQPAHQQIMASGSGKGEIGVGHFSEWSRATKKEFFIDWQASKESEWILVMGNEGGDLDSMASALAWAYHLEHSTANTSTPLKAIALLQTEMDALDLRPENKLALHNSKMTKGHEDLLTMDELPEDPETLSYKLKGIVLVDHAIPLRKWREDLEHL